MLVIRLTRTGKIHDAHYRIVVQERRSKLNGKAVDQIGHYHPGLASKQLVIDTEKAKLWLGKGAQTSDTVTNLFVREGIFDKSRTLRTFYTANKVKPETMEPTETTPTEEVAEATESTEPTVAEEETPAEESEETPAAEAAPEPDETAPTA